MTGIVLHINDYVFVNKSKNSTSTDLHDNDKDSVKQKIQNKTTISTQKNNIIKKRKVSIVSKTVQADLEKDKKQYFENKLAKIQKRNHTDTGSENVNSNIELPSKKSKINEGIPETSINKIVTDNLDKLPYVSSVNTLFDVNETISDAFVLEENIFSSTQIKDLSNIHSYLRSVLIDRLKLDVLTCVQSKSLPFIMAGKDVLIKSRTGSGKTLAFCLPIIQALQAHQPPLTRKDGVKALIICPTRELALQTYNLVQELLHAFVRIVCCLLVGGTKRKAQKSSIRKGVNIVVATPQRLLDHLQHTSLLDLSDIDFLVIDEADRLAEMGYEKDVRAILDKITIDKKAQTLLCSASLTPGVERLAGLALREPELVEEAEVIPTSIEHFLVLAPPKARLKALLGFLRLMSKSKSKGIVFLPTQATVDFHFALLDLLGLGDLDEDDTAKALFRLHGGMDHQERCRVFKEFSQPARWGLLITTDVCARGVDLPRVDWVIQYNSPGWPNDYLHRVGRTARLGVAGKALLFLQPQEAEGYIELLTRTTSVRLSRILIDQLTRKTGDNYYQQVVDLVNQTEEMKGLAEKAFLSFIRSYASFSGELRAIFNFRQLHLGHLASSFCLSETPKSISAKAKSQLPGESHQTRPSSSQSKTKSTSKVVQGRRVKLNPVKSVKKGNLDTLSEFASGLD